MYGGYKLSESFQMEENFDEMTESQKKSAKLRKIKIELMYKRDEMDKRAALIMKKRTMHRERREREAMENDAKKRIEEGNKRIYDLGGEDLFKIDEEKDEELRKTKNRLLILNTPEIQDLKKQVEAAYVRQELETQIEQKKSRLLTEKQYDRDQGLQMIKSQTDEEETLRQREIEKKRKYKEQLQDQILNKYRQKQIDYKNFLKERVLLEDSMRVVLEENQLEEIREKLKREKYKKNIEDFHKARALWTLREKEMDEQRDEKIMEFIKSKEKFEQEYKERRNLEQLSRDVKKSIVYESLDKLKGHIEERQSALALKCEQETERKDQEKQAAEWLTNQRKKKELADSFAKSLEDKLERLRREKLDDEAYMKEQFGKYQEDKKCLEMTDAKRRRLKMAYKSVLLRNIEERRYRRKLEEEELNKIKEQEDLKRKEFKKLIRDERLNVLKEHSDKLVGYLPAGTLKPDDLPHLPEHVRDYYSANHKPGNQVIERGDKRNVKAEELGKNHNRNLQNEKTMPSHNQAIMRLNAQNKKEIAQGCQNLITVAPNKQDEK